MNPRARRAAVFLARLVLGGVFVYLGAVKASDPALFLKNLRAFELAQTPWLLDTVAAVLPWLEIFSGLILIAGIARRGAALLLLILLGLFTFLIVRRALELHWAIPFCAISFDCGCGTGEINVCLKLAENIGLMALAVLVLVRDTQPPASSMSSPLGHRELKAES